MSNIKRINRELKYSGSILDIYSDTMEFSNGNTENWDYVAHRKGAAAVVPVLPNGKILLVRQERPAIERVTLEIPAGCRDSACEPTSVCAARELEEETGYKSCKLEYLCSIATTVAFCNEMIDIYVATDLVPSKQRLDANEFVDVLEYSIDEITDMILSGEIVDSKTMGALLAYKEKYVNR